MFDPTRREDTYVVEVRRPWHRQTPVVRLRERWRARADRRRAERARRNDDGDQRRWWDGVDLPMVDDLGPLTVVVVAVFAAVVLSVFIVVLGPFIWILVLFLVELIVWLLLALVGVVGGWVLGRPWQVAVVGPDGTTVATIPVRGRRRAREHADVVRSRLAAGADPTGAVVIAAVHGLTGPESS